MEQQLTSEQEEQYQQFLDEWHGPDQSQTEGPCICSGPPEYTTILLDLMNKKD